MGIKKKKSRLGFVRIGKDLYTKAPHFGRLNKINQIYEEEENKEEEENVEWFPYEGRPKRRGNNKKKRSRYPEEYEDIYFEPRDGKKVNWITNSRIYKLLISYFSNNEKNKRKTRNWKQYRKQQWK